MSSCSKFHSKYAAEYSLFENKNTNVFVGRRKRDRSLVAIKFFRVSCYKDYLRGNIPNEAFNQKKAGKIKVQNGRGSVLKMLDWYVYKKHIVFVTEYNSNFTKTLFDSTRDQPEGRFTEEECRVIFKLLLELVLKMNESGTFHLDLKPQNVLYDMKRRETKLIDFGHADSCGKGENPLVDTNAGTEGLQTPQQVENADCYGRDCDLWGVGQILYFCANSDYAFDDDTDVLSKKLEFHEGVSGELRDLLKRMLCRDVRGRIGAEEIFNHPWMNEE